MRQYHVLLLCTVGFGCGGAQLNPAKVSEVGASLRAAEELGATSLPKAALHLQLARDAVAAARRSAEEGEEENASLLLERAQADAELALQLTKTNQEREKARAAWHKAGSPEQMPR